MLLNDIPLKLDGVGAGLADERVAKRGAEGILGKLIPAAVTGDGDVFHAPIIAQRGAPATINLKKPTALSPCCIRT
jgi:hypothetical protein